MAEEEKDEQTESTVEDGSGTEADSDADADTSGEPEPEAAEADASADESEPEEPESADDPASQEPEPVAEADAEGDEDEPQAEPEAGADTEAEEAPPDEVQAVAPRREKKPRKTREEKANRRTAKKRARAKAKEDKRKPIVRIPKPDRARGARKERRGVVVSSKMDKTIVVRVESARPHPLYKKIVRRSVKFYAHDEDNLAKQGDVVRIVETRPLSKQKRWRLAEVVEKAT